MEYDLINSYKTLEEEGFDPNQWDTCPKCDAKPKVWIFDNGSFADCKCGKKYTDSSVSAIAVMTYYRLHNTLAGYPDNELRDNWNKRVYELSESNRIDNTINIILS